MVSLQVPSILSALGGAMSKDPDCLAVVGSKSKTWTLTTGEMSRPFWTAYAQAVLGGFVGLQDNDNDHPGPGLPPGTPPTGMAAPRPYRHC